LKKGEISANRASISTFILLNLWLQKKNCSILQSFGTTIADKLTFYLDCHSDAEIQHKDIWPKQKERHETIKENTRQNFNAGKKIESNVNGIRTCRFS
jgi:hypothetical protein